VRLAAIPPVRRAVPLRRGRAATRVSMEQFFGNRRISLYSSGTAALARAIAECAAQRSVSAPEVIIPAYGCPDLVAACVHASVFPRLVDVAPARWSYDINALQRSLTSSTVAVVAVNLLGLGDGTGELMPLCQKIGIPVIQDSAQCLPRERIEWTGDYVVLSFGRGKPLNLLRGGALIWPVDDVAVRTELARYSWRDRLLGSRAAGSAFNLLTHPLIYGMISALPGTGLGEVTYQPLAGALAWPEHAWKQVGVAFELYRKRRSYRRDIWTSAIDEWSHFGITELRSADAAAAPPEPLRLALLAPEKAARDRLVDSLSREGLGASRLYGSPLTAVAEIPSMVSFQGPFPNANELADRLFTLPAHLRVHSDTVQLARQVVRRTLARS
jgi:dTDP-4-amino-4,6-dideoxygalactose transaminase